MKVRAYPVLCRAIEDGVAYGWQRAHKHLDAPAAQTIEEQIVAAVVNEISARDLIVDTVEPSYEMHRSCAAFRSNICRASSGLSPDSPMWSTAF
jgi:hypothetical protein